MYKLLAMAVSPAAPTPIQSGNPKQLDIVSTASGYILTFSVKVNALTDDTAADPANFRRFTVGSGLYLGDVKVTLDTDNAMTDATTLRIEAKINTKLPGTTGLIKDE